MKNCVIKATWGLGVLILASIIVCIAGEANRSFGACYAGLCAFTFFSIADCVILGVDGGRERVYRKPDKLDAEAELGRRFLCAAMMIAILVIFGSTGFILVEKGLRVSIIVVTLAFALSACVPLCLLDSEKLFYVEWLLRSIPRRTATCVRAEKA